MEELQINMQDVVNKMKERIANDAQSIAILQATIDKYKEKAEEQERTIEGFMEKEVKANAEKQYDSYSK